MLTDNSFARLSDPVVGIAESFTLKLLKRLRRMATALISDPETVFNVSQELQQDHEEYVEEASGWVDENLPVAYMRGLKDTDGKLKKLDIDAEPGTVTGSQILARGGGGSISGKAADILRKYPQHHTMYSVFQEAAYEGFERTRLPVVRDVEDKVRELTIKASESQYRAADTFTRRQMSQELMSRFADDNITGIVYENGRRVNLDSYAEMVARSQTGNAARQASMNRQQQYGFDLVRISTHYPCSDLCYEEQGKVYSISGNHDHYPPLSEAIEGGLYHANCRHFQNPYFPGISESQESSQPPTGKKENKRRYQATQRQRTIERHIKKYKRREAAAVTDEARDKAKQKIRNWQGQQRELIESNDHLRRKYHRESING